MSKIARLVIWICSKFTKNEIQQIIAGLLDVLEDRNPEVKPKDDFKEKHPNYRNFSVDPLAPLTKPPQTEEPLPLKDYKEILAAYKLTHMASLYYLGQNLSNVALAVSMIAMPVEYSSNTLWEISSASRNTRKITISRCKLLLSLWPE